MRGSPRNAAPEHRAISSTPPQPRPETKPPERISTSPYAKPKILMGEVAMPRGALIGGANGLREHHEPQNDGGQKLTKH